MLLVKLSSQHLAEAAKLYESAFPEYERRPTKDWLNMAKEHNTFEAWAVTDNGHAFYGFITAWPFATFVYVEHFAISSSLRGTGIGGQAIDLFIKKSAPKPVVLEVEPPSTDMARRRIGFYHRHGLSLIPLTYSQPGYRPNAQWVPLSIMATHATWTVQHFDEVKQTIHQTVYGVKDKEP